MKMTMNGKAIAMTVAGLLLAVGPRVANADDKTKEAKVKCGGINSCKGKGGCAGASNSCSGQNGCKGKGWVETSAKECKDKKGTVIADKDAKDKDAKAPDKK
jgi:co-chaperonin GroES (HSP10)